MAQPAYTTETAVSASALLYDELRDAPELGFWKLSVRRFLHHRAATISLILMGIIVLAAIVVPIFQPTAYMDLNYMHPYAAPFSSPQHLFGTDDLGRDELARVVRGARVSLTVGLCAVVGYLIIGGTFGAMAGYFGGWVDQVLMRLTDIIIASPFLLVVIAVTAAFGGVSLLKLVAIIAILGWFEIGRLMRAQFLSLRESEYVMAARALGASDARIIIRHILPNALTPIIVSATLGVSGIILLEAALGFLGYSIPPPEPSWGNMLNSFEDYIATGHYYLVFFPAGALVLTALCINLIGDGIRDALDPRQR
ncbi:MAG TPA: ABC transporter permease [Isosphaeraceae bacterium]|nr:ABC transporter permease [Isosphaeraceae bacterium]